MQRAKGILERSDRRLTGRGPGKMIALTKNVVEEVVSSVQVWDVFCR